MLKHNLRKISCLIPAYKPSMQLLKLIDNLAEYDYHSVIIVDDGSGEEYKSIFKTVQEKGCIVINHAANKGKGSALKTGIKYCIEKQSDICGIVIADADGQHLVEDISNVANSLIKNTNSLIMGVRSFDKNVPFRSKFGNNITRGIYRFISGIQLKDTQTGLRGIPTTHFEKILKIKGDRYEYEMNMLMEIHALGLSIIQVPITTVYIDDNAESHFNPITDSIRIYKMMFLYLISSLTSFLIDYFLFILFNVFYSTLISDITVINYSLAIVLSNISARLISMSVNFTLNRKILLSKISSKNKLNKQIILYFMLALFSLLVDTLIVSSGSLILNPYIVKPISAIIIYIFNFYMQKRYIFT